MLKTVDIKVILGVLSVITRILKYERSGDIFTREVIHESHLALHLHNASTGHHLVKIREPYGRDMEQVLWSFNSSCLLATTSPEERLRKEHRKAHDQARTTNFSSESETFGWLLRLYV